MESIFIWFFLFSFLMLRDSNNDSNNNSNIGNYDNDDSNKIMMAQVVV